MAVKLTRLTHKIAIQLHLVTESCTIRSSRYAISLPIVLYVTEFSKTAFENVAELGSTYNEVNHLFILIIHNSLRNLLKVT
jgi:hypothetical protein